MAKKKSTRARRAKVLNTSKAKPPKGYRHWSAYLYKKMAQDVAGRIRAQGDRARVVAHRGEAMGKPATIWVVYRKSARKNPPMKKAKRNPRKSEKERINELYALRVELLRDRVKQHHRVVDVKGASKGVLVGMILRAEGYGSKPKKRKNPLLMVVPNADWLKSLSDVELERRLVKVEKHAHKVMGGAFDIPTLRAVLPQHHKVIKDIVAELHRRRPGIRPVRGNPLLMVVPNKGKKGKKAKKKNPPKAWHKRQAEVYRKRLADDLKADHKGGADYWQGAASAETRAVAKHAKNPPKIRKLASIAKGRKKGRIDQREVSPAAASAILKIYDSLSDKDRLRFGKAHITKMAQVARSVAKRV